MLLFSNNHKVIVGKSVVWHSHIVMSSDLTYIKLQLLDTCCHTITQQIMVKYSSYDRCKLYLPMQSDIIKKEVSRKMQYLILSKRL